jgi:uncharacterized membrane protein (DUF106 family)
MFDSFFNSILGSMISWNNSISLILISLILTFIVTMVYKFVTDQKMLKALKEEMNLLQEDLKKFKDNPAKMMEAQKVLMEKNMKMMMHTLKPTLFTFVPLLIIFGWLSNVYKGVPIFGINWLWTYIISSIVFSLSLRKLLKIY